VEEGDRAGRTVRTGASESGPLFCYHILESAMIQLEIERSEKMSDHQTKTIRSKMFGFNLLLLIFLVGFAMIFIGTSFNREYANEQPVRFISAVVLVIGGFVFMVSSFVLLIFFIYREYSKKTPADMGITHQTSQ
jgi:NADH:ubiquinone oxidoreductase subunit 2 (subunit N)